MAINKVEYKLDSLTSGFAEAGDEVTIASSNAKKIEKDVNANRTEGLNRQQQNFLAQCVNSAGNQDNTEYESTGNIEGEEGGEENSVSGGAPENNEDGKSEAATTLGSAAALAGLLFAPTINVEINKLGEVMNAYTAPWVGAADLALAIGGFASTKAFDSQYNDRVAEKKAEGEYEATIEESLVSLNKDIESVKGNAGYKQLSQLNEEYNKLVAAGKTEEAESLLQEMESARDELSDEMADIDIDTIKTNNDSAHEIDNYSKNVAQFLKQGTKLGALGAINTLMLTGCTAVSTLLTILAFRGGHFLTSVSSAIGAALCAIATGTFATSAIMMGIKTVNEFECGAKGGSLSSKLSSLQEPLDSHDEIAQSLGEFDEANKTMDENEGPKDLTAAEGGEVSGETGENSETSGESGSESSNGNNTTNG